MPTTNPSLPSDGDDAVVAPYNAAIQAILAVLNGAIDEDNLAPGAVILSKLAASVQAALVPSGTILAYGGSAAPSGFLLCYGQAVSRSTYSDLFAVVGTSFGTGNGTSTFNLPDLRGRVPVGNDAMGGTAANVAQRSTTISTTNASPTATVASATGLAIGMKIVSTNVPSGTTISGISGTTITMSANASATASGTAARFSIASDAQSVGAIGGESAHVLVATELAAHKHGLAMMSDGGLSSASLPSYVSGNTWSFDSTTTQFGQGHGLGDGNTRPNTGDLAHNIMQPSQIVNYMIKT